MFDYRSYKWTTHPLFEDQQIFSLSVPQAIFRPFGYLLDTVREIEGEEEDSYIAEKLNPGVAMIYYIPETPQKIDLDWLNSFGPTNPQQLINWSDISLQQYVDTIRGHSFDGSPDDFPARVLESIEENQLVERFKIGKREIAQITLEKGVWPFLSVNEIVINQPMGLYQICCECVLDTYFDSYGFGIYRSNEDIFHAAPDVSVPEW